MSTDVDTSRCPRCAAIVRPDSQWCMLCYADLRPAPRPPLPTAPPSSAQPTSSAQFSSAGYADIDPLTAPIALLEQSEPRGRHAAPEETTVPARNAAEAPEASDASWPCLKCGGQVSIDDSACPSCGAGFLESVDVDSSLHRLGLHTGQVSNQLKVLIMVGGSVGLLIVLVGLMYVIGIVF